MCSCLVHKVWLPKEEKEQNEKRGAASSLYAPEVGPAQEEGLEAVRGSTATSWSAPLCAEVEVSDQTQIPGIRRTVSFGLPWLRQGFPDRGKEDGYLPLWCEL